MLCELGGQTIKADVLVVIPTLGNRLNMLDSCLNSITSSKYKVEIVIIFPKNKTFQMKQFTSARQNVLLEPQNLNIIESVNYVLQKYTEYNYFTWISDDDLLSNSCIDRGVSFLESNTNYVATFGAVDYIDVAGRKIGKWNPPKFAQILNGFVPSAIKLEGSVFNLEIVRSIGSIPPTIKYCPDVYLILNLSKRGKLKKITGPSVAQFRIHLDSPTTNSRYKSNLEAFFLQFKLGSNINRILVLVFGPTVFILKNLAMKLIFRVKL